MTDRPGADGPEAVWSEVRADAAGIASQYRDRDWTVVTVAPQDVAPAVGDDHGGLAALLSDEDYERVAATLGAGVTDGSGATTGDDGSNAERRDGSDGVGATGSNADRAVPTDPRFDDADVYRRAVGDVGLAIAVERDRERSAAVVVPLYYRREEVADAFAAARDAGELLVHLRPRSSDDWVTFVHDDPSLFVPDDWTE